MRKSLLIFLFLFCSFLANATELVQLINTYQADNGALQRLYSNSLSAEYFQRMESFNQDYLKALQAYNYDSFSEDGKIDYVLFRNYLEKELSELNLDRKAFVEVSGVLAFASSLEEFVKGRRRAVRPNAQDLAASWNQVAIKVDQQLKALPSQPKYTSWQKADLAAQAVESLNKVTAEAYSYYHDFDPEFTWWIPAS